MTGFEGLENAGLIEGPQEKATREFIKEYRDGKAENPMADFIYSSMLSIARNIDVAERARPRDKPQHDQSSGLYPTARGHVRHDGRRPRNHRTAGKAAR